MHFNFHLSGDESPEQSRRVANAVLALGGAPFNIEETDGSFALRGPGGLSSFGVEPDGVVTEKGKDPRAATMDEMLAAGHHVTQGSGRYAEPGARWAEEDEPTAPVGGVPSDLPLNRADGWGEGYDENLGSDPITAGYRKLGIVGAPPIPTTSATEIKTPLTDHNGLPWDERIHSSSRAINADGTWRYRKNVPDETKRDVEAELSGLMKQAKALIKEPDDLLALDDATLARLKGNAGDSYGDASKHSAAAPPVPVPPTPPAPPIPTGALQRTYSDVVNLIMARKVQPDTYVAILGMSLPEFAKHVISAPNDATLMFDAIDAASRP